MREIENKEEMRELIGEWRRAGDDVALVPTMGNLHVGHLHLINVAREHADRVVVSIFVNPTQFGEDEDYEKYPRTIEKDKLQLKRVKTDALFMPDVETIYPFGTDSATSVTVPVLTEEFCGSFRPGHFDGVTTVVSRLFSLVQPEVAVFGEKDFQQLLIVKRLVEDLSLPIKVISAETQREKDGLAISSRNQYLSEEERKKAPELYSVLQSMRSEILNDADHFGELEKNAVFDLERIGFAPEYVSIRKADDLGEPEPGERRLVILAAVYLGETRLIDNVTINL
ncbi:MAG: pantoate--beta-alanine ligase [Gammaproteobacteria bacterium]|nr:pantoate--beta-alanine ligase [Gammaproteobacteria bacterium]